LRDWIGAPAGSGALGTALQTPGTGYSFVYHVEIALLFMTLAALGPLVRIGRGAGPASGQGPARIGLADFPT
jgi:BCD family chlorophyll transporter-like MFS transporter